MNRWYGGVVHELGHAFGLPDATSTALDGPSWTPWLIPRRLA